MHSSITARARAEEGQAQCQVRCRAGLAVRPPASAPCGCARLPSRLSAEAVSSVCGPAGAVHAGWPTWGSALCGGTCLGRIGPVQGQQERAAYWGSACGVAHLGQEHCICLAHSEGVGAVASGGPGLLVHLTTSWAGGQAGRREDGRGVFLFAMLGVWAGGGRGTQTTGCHHVQVA